LNEHAAGGNKTINDFFEEVEIVGVQ